MGANPSKRDAWPPYEHQRLVLVRREPWTAMPFQGLVIEWRTVARRHEALVAYVDESSFGSMMRMDWFDSSRLTCIPVDPNQATGSGQSTRR